MRLATEPGARASGAAPAAAGGRGRLGRALRGALSVLKAVAGMPDYARYVEHHRRAHPDAPLLSRAEHYRAWLAWRYGGGGPSRCC